MTDIPTWEETLDALECHLVYAEALLSGHIEEMPDETWVKPDGLGPLPLQLVDRAMALRERHAAVMTAVPEVLADNRRKREQAARMERRRILTRRLAASVDVGA